MAKRIFDIAKEFGLHPKVILAKAKELHIAQAKVVSSLLDDGNTLQLEVELNKIKAQQMNSCLSTELWPDRMQELNASVFNTERAAIQSICADPAQFFQWPQVGVLLWPGCVRTQNDGEHNYPEEVMLYLGRLGLKSDTRTNGPAILSFLAAGGKRPNWGNEGWPIHHIFDGTDGSPHAIRDGNLFTHSAGLVAAHPIAHHLAHQSALLKWLLWREAFLRFGFDPIGVFKDAK